MEILNQSQFPVLSQGSSSFVDRGESNLFGDIKANIKRYSVLQTDQGFRI